MPAHGPAGSPTAAERAVRRVLARYGFADSSVERVEPLTRRLKNENYRVRAGDADWVVKCHSSTPDLQRLELAQTLERRLADVGFPVAPIQQSDSGHTLVQEGGAHYSLHAWVDGRQTTIAERDRVIARHPGFVPGIATALGTMHAVAGTLPRPPGEPPAARADDLLTGPARASRRLRRLRPRPPLLSAMHMVRLKPGKSTFDRWIIGNLPGVARSADRLAAQSLRTSPEPIAIHNDINWENLIFDEDFTLRALLDFDNAMYAPPVIEVGAAAVVLVGTQRSRVDAFLAAYEDASHRRTDRDAVELAMRVKCAQSILNSVGSHLAGRVGDPDLLASWCSHLLDSLRELERW
ncbi:phosphotransferase [Ruania suaedae]|uniref:phosphotransferase n=1 Tax=Ruania suaedae TaxID=2897774 RepID=UPI001E63D13F|nr:phosphotransferase [Ruania suaedae]UFU02395.1 phosphotransferase [Ruania suaedae]